MTQIARISDTGNERRLQAERLVGIEALQEAQALRFNVFSGEFNATLKGAELGLDMDDYDVHCAHIGVRETVGRFLTLGRIRAGPRGLVEKLSVFGAFRLGEDDPTDVVQQAGGKHQIGFFSNIFGDEFAGERTCQAVFPKLRAVNPGLGGRIK